ncbi:hypothetical protein PPYR_01622 [Photinus pyralis]|uniref:FAM161 centrosomal protein A n=1 Tax=Photinus pyralis TaxID=7054 RepID=A0A5N4B4Y3_PHOPY|nr:protein FAM161A isoform X2 [Photinus pyralis]KAB0804652.1 hypothetical protein PPYR_01622 [Photinus pyralis]
MSDHNRAVFNNTCLKVPRDPISHQPSPIYEQKYVSNMKNEMLKMDIENKHNFSNAKSSPKSDKAVLKSLIEFYDSIPEYDDINHLSNKDFYRKLENLKERQRCFYKFIQANQNADNKDMIWMEDYQNFKQSPELRSKLRSRRLKRVEDMDSLTSSDKEPAVKPPSRRSVRIESPSDKSDSSIPRLRAKYHRNISSGGSRYDKSNTSYNESPWEDISVIDFRSDSDRDIQTRSAPNSPTKRKCGIGWKDNGITIPKPFQMTVRDEENKIVDDIMLTVQKPQEEKHELFRANPVPIESRIPMFNQIIAQQERRSEIVKQKSKETLKSQMRPFSFTRREEEIQALTKRLSKSSPTIFLDDDVPIKMKQFKAKPIPKGLFSNYVYQKMHEDEFYRALQRKIRAEEMLQRASLPPSMARREKLKPKPIICLRSFKHLESDVSSPKSSEVPNYKASHERLEKELDDLKNDFITTSPVAFNFKTSKRHAERQLKRCYGSRLNSSGSSRNAENYRGPSAADLLSVNKSNLAAVLRIQAAKKKMQMEMCRKLEETKLREESRWREKVLRKKPAWQALAYSHEEDLAMRLQLRKDEERLRSEEHRHKMELMFGRVNKMPMLFERQSHYKDYPVTKRQLIQSLAESYGDYCNKYPTVSPLELGDDLDKDNNEGGRNQKASCDLT